MKTAGSPWLRPAAWPIVSCRSVRARGAFTFDHIMSGNVGQERPRNRISPYEATLNTRDRPLAYREQTINAIAFRVSRYPRWSSRIYIYIYIDRYTYVRVKETETEAVSKLSASVRIPENENNRRPRDHLSTERRDEGYGITLYIYRRSSFDNFSFRSSTREFNERAKKSSSLSLWSRKLEEGRRKGRGECLGEKLYGILNSFSRFWIGS